MTAIEKPPAWFWIVAALLLLWEAVGVYACFYQVRLGPDAWPNNDDYDRALYASLPVWYNWVYAIATGAGLLGAIALIARRSIATPLLIVSLVAIVVMFGYVLGATDLIAHKGFATAAGFPIVIFLLGLLAVYLARLAGKRGWLS
ncbi:hypothetical protein EAH87_02025 [Sphingomonas koreensis]|nr:hypothetical protein EAH87_02025 [Sphingomonas koreensis]